MIYTKTISTIPHHTVESKEDPIPLVMTVVHFAKVSALYSRVVISSLAK
jgi:hypothetical protein